MLDDEVVTRPPNTFQSHQLGVGTTSGAEATVHACQSVIGDVSSTNSIVENWLQKCFQYNKERLHASESFGIFSSDLFFCLSSICNPCNLFFGTEILFSKEGVHCATR